MISKHDFLIWLVTVPLVVGVLCFVFGYVLASLEYSRRDQLKVITYENGKLKLRASPHDHD